MMSASILLVGLSTLPTLSLVPSAGAGKGVTPMPAASVLAEEVMLGAELVGMANCKFWLPDPSTD